MTSLWCQEYRKQNVTPRNTFWTFILNLWEHSQETYPSDDFFSCHISPKRLSALAYNKGSYRLFTLFNYFFVVNISHLDLSTYTAALGKTLNLRTNLWVTLNGSENNHMATLASTLADPSSKAGTVRREVKIRISSQHV